jgi:hypothetical protein
MLEAGPDEVIESHGQPKGAGRIRPVVLGDKLREVNPCQAFAVLESDVLREMVH